MSYPIHLSHVTCRLGREFAVRDLSLRVPAGAVYGLLGPNGCGKTTTIRLIMGMLRAHDGSVVVAGHNMPDAAAGALAGIGYVPERLHLYPGLSVRECVDYHRAFYTTWDDARSTELLGAFGLRLDMRVGAMSKGESGKLMLLLALATLPSLLVLDEPTDGLDPVARRDVLSAIMAYVADTGCSVLMTSHLVHEIERTCDWVGLMDNGALVVEEPMTAFRDALRRVRLASVPSTLGALPFSLVARRNGGRTEEWIIRGFSSEARDWMSAHRVDVLDVQPLDLEDTVVELLRSSRTPAITGGR